MLTLVCGVHIPCLHNLATTNHPCRPQRLNLWPLKQEIFVFWIFEKQITLSRQSKPKVTKLLQMLYSLFHCPCPGTVLCRIFLSERMSRSIWNCRSLSLQAPTFYRPQFSKEERWQKNRARLPKKSLSYIWCTTSTTTWGNSNASVLTQLELDLSLQGWTSQ